MKRRSLSRFSLAVVALGMLWWIAQPGRPATGADAPSGDSCKFPLPNPSGMSVTRYRTLLYDFLAKRCYENWTADRDIRNTGPIIWDAQANQINSYGTHLAVKVYYSPEVWVWLKDKNRQGVIPDGAMIVKEMFEPPATPGAKLSSWTVMIRDKGGSWDGWFWDGFGVDTPPDPGRPVPMIESGFGVYCIRCHASAADGSFTFSSVKNVEGDAVIYRVTVPSMMPEEHPTRNLDIHQEVRALVAAKQAATSLKRAIPPEFYFPDEDYYDKVVAGANGPEQFLTSSQCFACHSASPTDMAYFFRDPKKTPVNLSPYTEWHGSMMAMSGRDPVFHAQVESERIQFPDKRDFLDDKCFSCHGIMGQRQLQNDRKQGFKHEMVYALPSQPFGKYGALARDGVSCAACHHIGKEGLGTPATFTGQFKVDPADTINGPFDDVVALPMKNALGITPRFADQIKSSALCGSCHTVITPTFDKSGKQIGEFYEQTTYLEWLNSDFQNEPGLAQRPVVAAAARSCQDCHMPKKYNDRQLTYRIANAQDLTYPFSENLAPYKDITVKVRDTYSRHTLVGLNIFVNQMFQQFFDVLGIQKQDYMYSAGVPGLETAQNSMVELAEKETADLQILSAKQAGDALEIQVKVTNRAGHNFPSGVAFRRAFLELVVLDGTGNPLWASGRTSAKGEILDGLTSRVLPTEYFWDAATKKQVYQPHFSQKYPITRQDQAQIYEELVEDTDGKFTTSFVRLHKHVKENRLLPKGWKPDGPFAEHTRPVGGAQEDPGYINRNGDGGSEGSNTVLYRVPLTALAGQAASVRTALYYQTLPPYYLKDRAAVIGQGLPDEQTRDARRLKFFVDNMAVPAPIENWKLKIAGKETAIVR